MITLSRDHKFYQKPVVRLTYQSIAAMRTALIDPDARRTLSNENQATYRRAVLKGRGQLDWYGLDSTTETLDAIERGNSELTNKLMAHSITKKLPRAVGIGRQLMRSDMGDELCIHAVNRGDMSRAWSSKKRVVKRARNNIKIVVDIGGNCDVDANTLACRGLAGAGLAIALEKAGYSVAVIAAFASRNYYPDAPNNLVVTCQIKPAIGRISAGILATTVCLPGFFRTYGFGAIIRGAENQGQKCSDNLGNILAVEPLLIEEPATMTIVIPSSIIDDQSAQDWIAATIKLLEASA